MPSCEPLGRALSGPRPAPLRGRFRQRLPEPDRRVRLPRPALALPNYRETCARLERRLAPIPDGATHGASVLIVCMPGSQGPELLMTRRATSLRHHPGELSFPGGKVEPGESALAAALREAEEEIGLDPRAVRPLGLLGATTVRRQSRSMVAVVAALDTPHTLTPSPSEVEAIVEVPLGLFATEAFASELWFDARGGWGLVTFLALEEDLLWGASARFALELVALVTPEGSP